MKVKSSKLMGLSLAVLMGVGLVSLSAVAHPGHAASHSKIVDGKRLRYKKLRSHRQNRRVRLDRNTARFGTQRQVNQLRRIREGLRSGTLTRREARSLFRQQRRITRSRKFYLQDGFMSRFERRKLRRMLNRADRNIFRLSRNAFFNHRHRIRPNRLRKQPKRTFRTTVFS